MARYRGVIDGLLASGKAYRCNATKEALDEMREAQKARSEDPRYDRRNRDLQLGPDCGPHVIRLKLPIDGSTVVHDIIKGDVEAAHAADSQEILLRAKGWLLR
jgi:glutamyl-tRNA synthetase